MFRFFVSKKEVNVEDVNSSIYKDEDIHREKLYVASQLKPYFDAVDSAKNANQDGSFRKLSK